MGTETPFKNAYWDLKDAGLYVDIVTGEPLFSSLDKYDSGTGWPSFTRPLADDLITRHQDRGFFGVRTEVKSKIGGSHLGHVFEDGPKPTGLRYCMNSAALRFVPVADLDKAGYGAYLSLFKSPDASEKKAATKAVFAGGCFWCMEPPFDALKGVLSVVSGYSGGQKPKPNYEEVSGGNTGHYEVIEVTYDPKIISYDELLKTYWLQVDPLDGDGQFCDRGPQYRAAIFVNSPEQLKSATVSKDRWQQSQKFANKKIVTPILEASVFYPAEEYHQKYYQKNPIRYKYYRHSCGRDQRLQAVWGESLKQK